MTRTRLLAVLTAGALVVSACSGSDDPAANTDSEAPAETSGTTSASGTGGTDATGTATPDEPETTNTTERSEDAQAAIDAARIELNASVSQATAPWPTNWAMASIDLAELDLGIGRVDPRDSIPPIDEPQYESVDDAASWLTQDEPGALVIIEGDAYFFALSILHRHEIVNDEINGIPVAVTYCPLCNTALAFDRRLDGAVLRLGVSGLLRKSDLVMWDDQTVSLWQQITGEAIVGDATGQRLTPLSTAIVSFGDFATSYPDGLSLSQNTGFGIAYGANPYRGYSGSERPFLFGGDIDSRYAALSRVVGVTIGDDAKAYPFEEIEPLGIVNDVVGGEPIAVFWGGSTVDALDKETVAAGQVIGTGVAYLATVDGQVLTFTKSGDMWTDAETGSTWTLLGEAIGGPLTGARLETAIHRNEFWFAWGAFFPDGDVFSG